MSRRESRVTKDIPHLVIGGVNQRIRDTELPPQQYSLIEGLFPEFAGLQSRVWGKRVLEKYANAIYGIHQFWTPQGYGGGLYQFTGEVDFGYWLTPLNGFNLNIPPIGIDGGGMTLDEFGYPYGSNFGYGTDNLCTISFLTGSSDHSACNESSAGAGATDDSNGGPAGQGTRCRWEDVEEIVTVDSVDAGPRQIASGSYSNIIYDNPGVPYPTPPVPLGANPTLGAYSVTATAITSTLTKASYTFFAGTYKAWQDGSANNKRTTLNFASLATGVTKAELIVESLNTVPLPTKYVEFTFPVNEDGSYGTFLLNAADYQNAPDPVPHVPNKGFNFTDQVRITSIRLTRRVRVCS